MTAESPQTGTHRADLTAACLNCNGSGWYWLDGARRACRWDHQPYDLAAAWSEAEAALPEGWWLSRVELTGMNVEFSGGGRQHVEWWEAWARGPREADEHGTGSTPSLALSDLAGKLRWKWRTPARSGATDDR